MLEETIDPGPLPESFAERLSALLHERSGRLADFDWARCWNDREGAWTNLRTIEHWLDRSTG